MYSLHKKMENCFFAKYFVQIEKKSYLCAEETKDTVNDEVSTTPDHSLPRLLSGR